MEKTVRVGFTGAPAEAAGELERLAAGIRRGAVDIDGRVLAVRDDDDVTVEIEGDGEWLHHVRATVTPATRTVPRVPAVDAELSHPGG